LNTDHIVGGQLSNRPYLWFASNGETTASDLLFDGPGVGIVHDVNESGQAVGLVSSPDLGHGAFRWSNGEFEMIGIPGPAVAINSSGHVVGRTSTLLQSQAFLFDGNGVVSLGTLGGSESAANDINDADAIVGVAETSGGHSVGF
jgi:probable HAF family extracellular repeat protein